MIIRQVAKLPWFSAELWGLLFGGFWQARLLPLPLFFLWLLTQIFPNHCKTLLLYPKIVRRISCELLPFLFDRSWKVVLHSFALT